MTRDIFGGSLFCADCIALNQIIVQLEKLVELHKQIETANRSTIESVTAQRDLLLKNCDEYRLLISKAMSR